MKAEAAVIAILVVLLVGMLVLTVSLAGQEEEACKARGGKYHCTTTSGVTTGGHAVFMTSCACYSPTGGLLP